MTADFPCTSCAHFHTFQDIEDGSVPQECYGEGYYCGGYERK